jgi:hypothetical protein
MSRDDYFVAKRSELVAKARQVLGGNLGIIEGYRALVALGNEADIEHLDEDFLTLIAVDSETDALPVGPERRLWDSEALRAQDRAIEDAEALYAEAVHRACERLVERFDR